MNERGKRFERGLDDASALSQAEIARLTGLALCEYTQSQLWQTAYASDALYLNHELQCRVGTGRATYHRFDSARRTHLIVFGQKMIVDKWQSALHGTGSLERWLTVREIRRYGFFGGRVSLCLALLQTCLHEFAHLLQTVERKRRYRSVHNSAFYATLHRLHDRLDLELAQHQLKALLPPQLASSDVFEASVAPPRRHDSEVASRPFAEGDPVVFQYRQQLVRAFIIKRNRVNYKLKGRGTHSGLIYRCHPSLLSPDLTVAP